jgi:cysteine desulfurase/selenocysteine lyase
MVDPKKIKQDFPIFKREINGRKLVYLDNAATTQKPQIVLDTIMHFYKTMNANTHRGVHALSQEATTAYEEVREKVARFINAVNPKEIIFTSGTTETINLVASTWGQENITKGDEIVVSELEHHSNLVPWQQLRKRKGAKLKFIPVKEDGILDLSELKYIITRRTKLVAVTMMSNAVGTIVPVEEIIKVAKSVGAKVLIDAAQGAAHLKIDVGKLNCDFFALSSHKMLGPTGVGVLYGKRKLLKKMSPYKFGGDMVLDVSKEGAVWNDLPQKFEAGTQNIAGVVGFGAAIDFLEKIGMDEILKHDQELARYAIEKFSDLPKIQIYGPKDPILNGGIVAFNIKGVHPHDVGSILSEEGVCIRTGHHCAQPLLNQLGISSGTARMSFYVYNSKDDIDIAFDALQKVYEIFRI